MRICYGAPSDLNVTSDNKNNFFFYGHEAEYPAERYNVMSSLFPNASHRFESISDCDKQVFANETDLGYSSRLTPLKSYENIEVPVVVSSNSVQISNLFKANEVRFRDVQNILLNFKSLCASVYWSSLALVLILVSLVVTRVILHHSISRGRRIKHTSAEKTGSESNVSGQTKWNTFLRLFGLVLRHLNNVFYYSSDDFKLICFIYSVLAFFMLLAINSVFTTSQLIIESPGLIKNFKELAEHPTASLCIDVHQRIDLCGARDMDCRAIIKNYHEKYSEEKKCYSFEAYKSIFANRDVIISISDPLKLRRKVICALHMEWLPETRSIAIFYQNEILLGLPVSKSFVTKELILKLDRMVESGIHEAIDKIRVTFVEAVMKSITKVNSTYYRANMNSCDREFEATIPDGELKPLGPGHLGSLGKLMVISSAIASLVLVFEMVAAPHSTKWQN